MPNHRFAQQPSNRQLVCPRCRMDDCESCPDVLLARVNRSIGCTCSRNRHPELVAAARGSYADRVGLLQTSQALTLGAVGLQP